MIQRAKFKISQGVEHLHTPTLAIADALFVLKRDRGQADATLLLTSPDLPDQELALRLPTDTMSWTLLGPATDYHLSQERQDILALLREYHDGPLSPKEIASLLHKDVRAVTKLLFDMSHAAQIRLIGRGKYMTIKSHNTLSTQQPDMYSLSLEDEQYLPSFSNNGNESNESNKSNEHNQTNQSYTNPPFNLTPSFRGDMREADMKCKVAF